MLSKYLEKVSELLYAKQILIYLFIFHRKLQSLQGKYETNDQTFHNTADFYQPKSSICADAQPDRLAPPPNSSCYEQSCGSRMKGAVLSRYSCTVSIILIMTCILAPDNHRNMYSAAQFVFVLWFTLNNIKVMLVFEGIILAVLPDFTAWTRILFIFSEI